MTTVHVMRVEVSSRETLRNLTQLYTYDFSEMLGLEVEEDGRFAERPLDAYWTDRWRFPFFIRVDSRLAGFAMVHRKSKLSGANDVWDMAEFFVLRKHRRAGVGSQAAHRLFATHPGRWEVRQRKENPAATLFWRKTIDSYTSGDFSDEVLDDARWRGPVQRFTSQPRPAT